MPLSFQSGLRYLAPALILGLALLPVVVGAFAGWRRIALLGALLFLLAFADASGAPWYSGYLGGALAVGAAAAALAALPGWWRVRLLPRWAPAAAAVAIVLAGVAAGWVEQRRYLDHRYAEPTFAASGLNAAFRWARGLSDQRIATNATRQYPLWGTELSNRVQYVGLHRPHAGFVDAASCTQWRRLIDAGRFDYVVASLDRRAPGGPSFPPEASWTRGPNAFLVLRRAPTAVYRIDGPLPPSACRRGP
jgi:hypothetical protein